MTEAASVTKDEILKVCRSLKAFEKRQPDGEAKSIAGRLRHNLAIAACYETRLGFNFVLAEQVAALEAARRD